MKNNRVLIFGATGNMGGAALREMLLRGWQVRAVTRNPQSEKALALGKLGAEVVQGDMENRVSLEPLFEGFHRVFSVQSWASSGVEGEVRQGKIVADVAKKTGVLHLVYGSAGVGEPGTGVPHFDSKLEVERYIRDELGLPTTVVRPGPFMELMTEKEFFPLLGAWGMMPKLVGWETVLPWTSVADIGATIANVFENPDRWIEQDIQLLSDLASMRSCQQIFKATTGKKPAGLALPVVLFKKVAGSELVKMWRWLSKYLAVTKVDKLKADIDIAREVCPDMHSVTEWLMLSHNGHRA